MKTNTQLYSLLTREVFAARLNSSFSAFSSFWRVPVRKTHPAAKVQLPGKFCERKSEEGEKFSCPSSCEYYNVICEASQIFGVLNFGKFVG